MKCNMYHKWRQFFKKMNSFRIEETSRGRQTDDSQETNGDKLPLIPKTLYMDSNSENSIAYSSSLTKKRK